jgi:hypothetical protein
MGHEGAMRISLSLANPHFIGTSRKNGSANNQKWFSE